MSKLMAPDALMVTADIEGVMEPQQVPLPQAIVLLWEALRALPLGAVQYGAYEYFFGDGVEQRVLTAIQQDGWLNLTFRLEGELRSVRIAPAVRTARVR